MKTFKHFLEEAANAIKSIRDSGFKLKKGGYKDPSLPDGMMRWGWTIKKAKLNKDDKINSLYKDINNPKKPSEKDLINGLPIKKA
jgi:hypothetical protein